MESRTDSSTPGHHHCQLCESTSKEEAIRTETLRQNVLWSVCNPVVNIERRAGGFKIAIVEHQEILVLIRKALDDMSLAFGKVPDIAFVQDLELVAPELVDSTHGDLALVNVSPFGLGFLAKSNEALH